MSTYREHPNQYHRQPANHLAVVLPPSSTKLERDLVQVADTQNTLVIIPTVKDPNTCPAELLDAMAFERSVDVWSQAWPEATKREMLKTARLIQARKGTVWAVREILKAFGQPNAEIIERAGARLSPWAR